MVGIRSFAVFSALCCAASGAQADIAAVQASAEARFSNMPRVEVVDALDGCGIGPGVNRAIAYCTSEDRIMIRAEVAETPMAPYLLAHVYGHAVQVEHGVADVAFLTIRRNRDNETALRHDVTRMVECIAGVILNGAGLAADLDALFATEPFTDSHWGRNPLVQGPKVSLGLQERNRWLKKGQEAGHPGVCDTESFPATLVVDAFRR